MKKVWPWIVGVVVVVAIVGMFFVLNPGRAAYWTARRAVHSHVGATQDQIDAAVEAATAAVDRVLELSRNLPSQQAKADLVKQDIEEIGNRLKGAAEAKGDAAVDKLDASIDKFNQALNTVDEASKEATDPAAKATLYHISSLLQTAKEKIVRFVLTAGQ
jgi:hypothetical protein